MDDDRLPIKKITVDSRERTAGTPSDFQVQLPEGGDHLLTAPLNRNVDGGVGLVQHAQPRVERSGVSHPALRLDRYP